MLQSYLSNGTSVVSNYTVKDDKEVAVNDVKSGMD